jgi:hypothetical protein
MTNTGMFEDPEKIEYLTNQNKLLKLKLKEAVSKIKRIQGLEVIHAKNNGDLRLHILKIEKENKSLKAEIDRISEERDNFQTLAKK